MKTYVSTYLHFCFRGGTDKHRNTRKLFYPYKSFVTFWDRKDWYSSSSQKSTMTASPSLEPLWCYPFQEATLKYSCSATGSMVKSVGCDTSSLQKQGRGEVRVYNCLFRSQWTDSYWSCEKVYRLSTLSWTHLRLVRISSLDLPISRAGSTLHATCGGVAGNSAK